MNFRQQEAWLHAGLSYLLISFAQFKILKFTERGRGEVTRSDRVWREVTRSD